MPTPPSKPTIANTSPDQSCDCCGSCHCGTDCATGTPTMNRTYLPTNFGSFSLGYYGQLKLNGSFTDRNFNAGTNIFVADWAYVTQVGSQLAFTWGPNRALWFDGSSPFAAKFGARQVLTQPNANDYRIFDPDSGTAYTFDIASGLLRLTTLPGGQTVTNTITSGKITDTIWRDENNNVREVRKYIYNGTTGLLDIATLQRTTSDGTQFARVSLAYYGAGTSNGNNGDLRSVSYELPNGSGGWTLVGTDYFRYYTSSSSTGFVHGLKYVVRPEEVAVLESNGSNPDSASDATVSAVADAAYEYNSTTRRVTRSTTLGSHSQTFEYTDNSASATNDFNHWRLKLVVTYQDGSKKTVYTNTVRQVMLTDHQAVSTNPNLGRWIDYTKYHDTYGRVTERYTPAAINMSATPIYTDTALNLAVSIRAAAGLVSVTTYYGASPPPPAGGVAGYPSQTSVRAGASGTSNVLRALEYGTRAVSGDTLVYPTKTTSYRNDNTTGPIVTLYESSFHSGTFQVQTRTSKLPVVPTSQNGDNKQYVIVESFDRKGWLTNRTDAYDLASPPSHIPSASYTYDPDTGGVLSMTQDPGGMNIVTDYTVDSFGRTTQVSGPAHNINGQSVRTITWNVYMDAQREFRTGQGSRVGSTDTLVNPVSITKKDRNGRVLEEIEAARTSTSGALTAGDTFGQDSYSRWTTRTYTNGDLTSVKVYHDIPSSGAGTRDLNYAETNLEYDSMGRQAKTTSPGNGGSNGVGAAPVLRTITWNVFDARDNVIETYVGTDAFGGTDASPDSYAETTANNMIRTATNVYDNNNPVGGNGLLTQQILHVDAYSSDRITNFAYDFRNRQTTVTQDSTGSPSIITQSTYDNLDQVIQVDQFQNSIAEANRIARSKAYFDDRSQVYLTEVYSVTPGNGTPINPQSSKTWYDGDGRVVKQHPAGSKLYSKSKYDAIGRTTDSYAGYSPSNNDDPWTVGSGDTIFEQSHSDYDVSGNSIKATGFQRNVDATGTGALTTSNARTTYVGQWYDGVGRPIATANYGTVDFDRGNQSSPPSISDDVLVSQIAYNPRGEAWQTTDPKGMVTETVFDDAGRQVSVSQTGTNDGGGSGTTTTSTSMTYTPDGGVRTLTAANATTLDQTTKYVYGTDRPNTVLTTVARSDLLVTEIYPDSTDGSDNISYNYNRQADRVQMTDQNGTVHQYEFDRFGRPTADKVTTFGSGANVDETVKRIEIAYEVRGMVSQVTSKDAASGGNVVNQVTLAYNGFRQLVSDSQKHSASATAVDVEYQYEDGSGNTTRRKKVVYPTTTRALDILYDDGADDSLGRVSHLKINGETNAAATYKYFGLGSVAKVSYPQPAVSMTLADATPSYPGIDKFGRVVDLYWKKDSGSSPDRVRLKYGYDRASNRKYRRDMIAHPDTGTPLPFDELYSYDGVHRLTWFGRGTLDSGNSSLSGTTQRQTWTIDQTGNWSQFEQDSPSLTQLRLHNKANEILPNYPAVNPDLINKTAGDYWAGPLHDRNGNMTKMPQPATPTSAYTAKYDAWNRLVELKDAGTSAIVASFQYDGHHRRTIKTVGSTVRHFIYSDGWQVLEERIGTSTTPDRQFVWGLRYLDDLVLRDCTNSAIGDRRYAIQDANWNVVAILDSSGSVDERLAYEAYGKAFVLSPGYSPQPDAREWETRFTSQRCDLETSLYLYRMRYYNFGVGRFIGRDLIMSGTNLLLYARANPISNSDALGLWASTECCKCKGPPTISYDGWTWWEGFWEGFYLGYKVTVTAEFNSGCNCILFSTLTEGQISHSTDMGVSWKTGPRSHKTGVDMYCPGPFICEKKCRASAASEDCGYVGTLKSTDYPGWRFGRVIHWTVKGLDRNCVKIKHKGKYCCRSHTGDDLCTDYEIDSAKCIYAGTLQPPAGGLDLQPPSGAYA